MKHHYHDGLARSSEARGAEIEGLVAKNRDRPFAAAPRAGERGARGS
jgi:hypothetical protein